jgi:hypothetical protein
MVQRTSSEEEADSFDKVARLVAGGDPPKWLARHFKNYAASLGLHRRVVMRQPTRSAMIELLSEIEGAAGLLSYALSNNPTREFLENSRLGPIDYAMRFENDLTDFALRILAAKNSLSSKEGGAKPGPGKAMPPDATTPHVYCAAMIAEAWHFLHEGYPAAANREAAAAADVLWNLSKIPGGVDAANDDRIRWGTDKLNGWRPHFIAALAQKPVMGNDHGRYVRSMEIAAQMEEEATDPCN